MKHLKEKIKERKQFLEGIIREKKISIENAPEGIINIAHTSKRTQYYYKQNSEDKKRRYIRKEEMPYIKALCQKDYDLQVIEIAEQEIARINNLIKLYEKDTCENI